MDRVLYRCQVPAAASSSSAPTSYVVERHYHCRFDHSNPQRLLAAPNPCQPQCPRTSSVGWRARYHSSTPSTSSETMRSQELRSGVSPYMVLRASHTRQRHGTHHRPNPHVCEGPPTLNAVCRCRACPLVVLAWTAAIIAGVRITTKDFGGEITTHPFSPSEMERF